MPLTLDEACSRLDAALRAHNEAKVPSDTSLAMLTLDAAVEDALAAFLLAQPDLASDLDPRLAAGEQIELGELLDAVRLATGELDEAVTAALKESHAFCKRLVLTGNQPTTDELYYQAHRFAGAVVGLWPLLSTAPAPLGRWPIYHEGEPVSGDVSRLQLDLKGSRQRVVDLEQNTQRLSRALAAANNEVDRLRTVVSGPEKQTPGLLPAWQEGLRAVALGVGLIALALVAYLLARLALRLPWPWLLIAIVIVLAVPAGLYFGLVFLVRGAGKLTPDRLVSYAATLLVLAALVAALFDRSGGGYAARLGSVTTRWAQGALRSPLTLVRAAIAAPAPFVTAFGGRSAVTDVATPTPEPAIVLNLPTATVTPIPEPATPTPTDVPVAAVETPPATPAAAAGSSIQIGGKVRVTNASFLNARSGAGLSFERVVRFDANTVLTVLQGPVVTDNYTWWEVQGDTGRGWCADDYLVPAS